MNTIKLLDKDSIYHISNGKKIINLAETIKELVENSIDSYSKQIDVQLNNFGLNEIQIIDNGHGINSLSHSNVCKKHFTSKIKKIKDLDNISSLGFRGEALSSIAGLSNITIYTKTKKEENGFKLIYDHNGTLVGKEVYPKKTGTTIKLTSLFCTLPVIKNNYIY